MTQPLAFVLYEKLLPGTQLVNRLQDLNYRVQVVPEPGALVAAATQEKPLVVLADVESTRDNICGAIASLRRTAETQHIPVIALVPDNKPELEKQARDAGATLVVNDNAILNHLTQFLEQALRVE